MGQEQMVYSTATSTVHEPYQRRPPVVQARMSSPPHWIAYSLRYIEGGSRHSKTTLLGSSEGTQGLREKPTQPVFVSHIRLHPEE